MEHNKVALTFILTLSLSACGGGSFSAGTPDPGKSVSKTPQAMAGDGGDDGGSAGAPISDGGTASGSGGSGGSDGGEAGSTSGSTGGVMSTAGHGGTGGSTVSVGGSGTASGGTAGSGTAVSGGAAGTASGGTAGMSSVFLDDPKYACEVPTTTTRDPATAFSCMKAVCSNLGYQCGVVNDNNACSPGEKSCGLTDDERPDCSYFLSSGICPSYNQCDASTHLCSSSCLRDKVTTFPEKTSCHETVTPASNMANFRYQCGDQNPKSSECVKDMGQSAGSGTWCCSYNSRRCMVQYQPSISAPGCGLSNSRPYVYTCPTIPDQTKCVKSSGESYCCSDPNIE